MLLSSTRKRFLLSSAPSSSMSLAPDDGNRSPLAPGVASANAAIVELMVGEPESLSPTRAVLPLDQHPSANVQCTSIDGDVRDEDEADSSLNRVSARPLSSGEPAVLEPSEFEMLTRLVFGIVSGRLVMLLDDVPGHTVAIIRCTSVSDTRSIEIDRSIIKIEVPDSFVSGRLAGIHTHTSNVSHHTTISIDLARLIDR